MPSKQVLETKKGIVDELAQEFSQAQSIVLAEYRGLTVAQDTEMRAA
ncbi:MAG: 50S ribosomal protein L10, partial [Eubacteriales bacterium]|nr:50S ribosomal protein L10 [Eubacteriales bacterium]